MTILDTIIDTKREELAAAKKAVSSARMAVLASQSPRPRDFAGALRAKGSGAPPNVIAELKKASPSKGVIRDHFAPAQLAEELAAAGAAALSVLTDEQYFQGSLDNLRLARRAVDIPIIRKDFTIDEYQILEARANGADAILLIAAALEPILFKDLLDTALDLGLGVLSEVHNQAELDMVLATPAPIVGVNSRDLKTFNVDLGTTRRMMGLIPPERVRVAESGVDSRENIVMLGDAGADAFLVGEHLMRDPRPGRALRKLLGAMNP
ncbi:MAG: indole-3-glycerol phosphate synthase TrpC [Lentisphaeria bacterium]|nr:indole-3-glycerol phosphate synthase TrpC [Lentisphaeria bacterium]